MARIIFQPTLDWFCRIRIGSIDFFPCSFSSFLTYNQCFCVKLDDDHSASNHPHRSKSPWSLEKRWFLFSVGEKINLVFKFFVVKPYCYPSLADSSITNTQKYGKWNFDWHPGKSFGQEFNQNYFEYIWIELNFQFERSRIIRAGLDLFKLKSRIDFQAIYIEPDSKFYNFDSRVEMSLYTLSGHKSRYQIGYFPTSALVDNFNS